MPRTESECTVSSCDDEELFISPILDVGLPVGPDGDEPQIGKQFITLRERRQIKLGLRKVVQIVAYHSQCMVLKINVQVTFYHL